MSAPNTTLPVYGEYIEGEPRETFLQLSEVHSVIEDDAVIDTDQVNKCTCSDCRPWDNSHCQGPGPVGHGYPYDSESGGKHRGVMNHSVDSNNLNR